MNFGLAEQVPGDPGGGPIPPRSQVVMNGQSMTRTVTIRDPQGLHMRPAAAFAKAARQFESAVTVRFRDRSVNGKSQLDLMLLAAEPGAELVIEAVGDDAATALAILAELIEAVSAEGDENDAGPPPSKS